MSAEDAWDQGVMMERAAEDAAARLEDLSLADEVGTLVRSHIRGASEERFLAGLTGDRPDRDPYDAVEDEILDCVSVLTAGLKQVRFLRAHKHESGERPSGELDDICIHCGADLRA